MAAPRPNAVDLRCVFDTDVPISACKVEYIEKFVPHAQWNRVMITKGPAWDVRVVRRLRSFDGVGEGHKKFMCQHRKRTSA